MKRIRSQVSVPDWELKKGTNREIIKHTLMIESSNCLFKEGQDNVNFSSRRTGNMRGRTTTFEVDYYVLHPNTVEDLKRLLEDPEADKEMISLLLGLD